MNRHIIRRAVAATTLIALTGCATINNWTKSLTSPAPKPQPQAAAPAPKVEQPKSEAPIYPVTLLGKQLDNNDVPPQMAQNAKGTLGTVEWLDPAAEKLIPASSKLEILADNISWAEGPCWFHNGLVFSDIPQNTVYRWTKAYGIHQFLKPSGYTGTERRGGEPGSNAMTLDPQGRLTLCQHGDRRVIRIEENGAVTVLADKYEGKRLNSPNDLCYDCQGNLYFTDPPYGLEHRDKDTKKELPNSAYLRRTDGKLIRLALGDIVYPDGKTAPVMYPNGVALSPDEKTLMFCISDPEHPVYMKYEVQPDGTIANGTLFYDMAPFFAKKLPGLPDGIKFDQDGNVWCTGPGGVYVFTPEGKMLANLATGVKTANLGWGDDGKTLYVCADSRLCRIRTSAKGILPGKR